LADLLAIGNGQAVLCWSLQLSSDGSTLSLFSQTDNGPVELLSTNIAWQAGAAYCVGLNYGTNGTALFLDGQVVAQGAATLPIPAGSAELVLAVHRWDRPGKRRFRPGLFFRQATD